MNTTKINNSIGYLELFIGPMFSGKTSKILEIYKQCNFCNIDVLVINHSIDTRYDAKLLSTHNNEKIDCEQLNQLKTLFEEGENLNLLYKKSKVILINEGQFFEDLYDSINIMLNDNKQIYVCGLDGDFERKKFGQILDLIPLCDKVIKFTSLCNICKDGTLALFSKRLSSEKDQTLIGVTNYAPVCRNCYHK